MAGPDGAPPVSELIFVEERPLAGREHPVIDTLTVGRQGCDVLLPDPQVSRRHAVIRATPAGPAIEDLGSTNGTFVNGERVKGPHRLRPGDQVRFGHTVWHVREVRDPAQATTSAGTLRTGTA